MRESNTVEEKDLNIQNITDKQGAIERIKTGNRNTMRNESIQRQVLKKFKDTKGFVIKTVCKRSKELFT